MSQTPTGQTPTSQTPSGQTRDLARTLAIARSAVRLAADRIRVIYDEHKAGGDVDIQSKGKDGPVTAADNAANAILIDALRTAFPEDAILSEESPESWISDQHDYVWMIDPLDGTKEFIKANGEFVCMIGLVHLGKPVLGVVTEPATFDEFFAAKGLGAWRVPPGHPLGEAPIPLKASAVSDTEKMTVAISRSHRPAKVEHFMNALGITQEYTSGSVGRKIALCATGRADIYLHASPGTKLWDLAGPHAIIEEAGGHFVDANGEPFVYRRPKGDVKNMVGILACGGARFEDLKAAAKAAMESGK